MATKRVILAEYFISDDVTLLFIMRSDLDEPQAIEIRTPADEIRQFVTDNFGMAQDSRTVRELDVDEWQTRIGPFVEPILPWANESDIVWLVPHDVLHYLPLHALKVEGRYLIERNPVCYTPSASVMKYCHAKRKGRRERAFVLGDSRNDLMHAREEAYTVAELFSTTPCLDNQATKSLVENELARASDEVDILHFACHGYFHPEQALKSSVVLAPEQNGGDAEDDNERWNLTAEEIFGLDMRAELVTLSACETGINERRPGEELIGLTRSLIYAGTPSVMVSLWAVNDLSTGLLMKRFYQDLRQLPDVHDDRVTTKAEALQSAQLYVKNLTAWQIIDYCTERLTSLASLDDPERKLQLQLDRANAQAIAGNLPSAIDTYRDVQAQLKHVTAERARNLAMHVEHTLDLLEFKAEATPSAAVDYNVQPFEHPYYWAPFVLVGDWK
jgi:CHAT domain-containing protein